jgi:putative ABC transport system permease protein
MDNSNLQGITAAMEERWKKIVPESPLNFLFMEQHYEDLYRSETRLSRIMSVFSILAILIAGLGLFGLASYTIMQRTKELGIRKVLGASLSRLIMVVSGNFITLVLIAFAIAAPVSWYAMTDWLGNFAYPVGFNWMIVVGAGFLATLVAAGTVVYHAFEAARVNPATTLRSE